ncbi:hypothetical protein BFU36_01535 [Sulfolobus sp. A20]|uniref:hypothetical protein n=1 Tax=Sulfolobaceae TaxID=118883 RepID=UPI00084609B0|nr:MULTISPECIES: hypothetical protein [unclassified Sulfolobus]TRM78143.1 hypothetical protein DJ532_01945 [Sulfolobus sp. A20-N-F8]TRM81512.1 hypothetical protein DJ524_03805 [Sulfolobus sp. D5]TRM84170.1 hypothetical protein DJ531_02025 [Sulfolobus sp. A20-N-F6]TRM87282.1 hypothetical protein DJ521_03855 [Sulfolobus sp. E3]TRM88663.1 hypothetical protein DJ529_04600 [Sulfolobus sp. C3]TRM98699.1 hypothetical protein DJ527_09965 [Sulfolobus sp. F1]
MSILEEEEFRKLKGYKGKINYNALARILDEIELDLKSSKDIKTSIIYIYTNHLEEVKKNKEFYELVAEILQKYYQKIGIENVNQLILSILK